MTVRWVGKKRLKEEGNIQAGYRLTSGQGSRKAGRGMCEGKMKAGKK